MGTRGSWGFRIDGKDKLTYNHYDSYPSGLGEIIKKFIANHSIKELREIATKIILVSNAKKPTKEQIKECEKYADTGVSTGSLTEWYVLLRNAQGEPEAYANDLRYMISNPNFIKDSLFCEWAYIINLDTEKLEIYTGPREEPQDNRYRIEPQGGYANCKLIKEIPLNKVKDLDMEKIDR